MTSKKPSLRDLAAAAKGQELAAANTQTTDRIMTLDPALVHPGGLAERLEVDEAELEALAESIRTAGQKVPILVRPHPGIPGEYEIVAGRRRLEACRRSGISVRAEVQDLDDRSLVIAQAIENIAREDLSYIERARLAVRMVDEAGLEPAAIDTAFACGKTERSRYLKIGRGIPDDIVAFVGKAPGIGRPRWEKLATRIEEDDTTLGRIRQKLAAANSEVSTPLASDARFDLVFAAAFAKEASPPSARALVEEIRLPTHLDPVGRIKRTRSGVQVTLHAASDPGFVDWVTRNGADVVKRLMTDYAAARDRDEA
jgi:ParB family chromosome partitioning protein